MKKLKYFSRSCIGLIIILIILSGCINNSVETYWYTEPSGILHTNDIERAQKEIPFNIILPTYLPDNINTEYPAEIICPLKWPENGTGIQIIYYNEN